MVGVLLVLGGLLTVVGIVLIPLPGPGFLVLTPGVAILVVGMVVRGRRRRTGR